MSGDSSLLVEKLWRLKRRIDKGACPGVEFVHLNTLLREPNYRADVLRRVESAGTPELKALAREIREVDSGEPLMAREVTSRLASSAPQEPKRGSWLWRNRVILLPVMAVCALAAGFTAFENRAVRVDADITADTTWSSGSRYILEKTIYVENASLTIEPGVVVEGESGSALVVTADAKLFVRGRADSRWCSPVPSQKAPEPVATGVGWYCWAGRRSMSPMRRSRGCPRGKPGAVLAVRMSTIPAA